MPSRARERCNDREREGWGRREGEGWGSTCDAEQGVGEVDAREVGAVRDHVGELDELGPAPAREQLRVAVLEPHTHSTQCTGMGMMRGARHVRSKDTVDEAQEEAKEEAPRAGGDAR